MEGNCWEGGLLKLSERVQQKKKTTHRGISILLTADSYRQSSTRAFGDAEIKKNFLSFLQTWLNNKDKLFILLKLKSMIARLLFSSNKRKTVFFPLEPPFEQWRPFFPLRCRSSSRGKSLSAGPKRRKGKQEGVDTLQHQPSSTINISLHAPILGTSGGESVISMKRTRPVTA